MSKILKNFVLILLFYLTLITINLSGQIFVQNNYNSLYPKKNNIFYLDNIRDGKDNLEKKEKLNKEYFLNEYLKTENNIKDMMPIEIEINKFELTKKYILENSLKCHVKNCFIPHGVCLNDMLCKCAKNYANLKSLDINKQVNNLSNRYLSNFLINNFLSNYFSDMIHNFYKNSFCSYHKKSQLIAFILESTTLIGMGHFYLNRIFHGFLKLILFSIILIITFIIKKKKIRKRFFLNTIKNKKFDYIVIILDFVVIFFFLIFHFFDIIMLATNNYTDGFGIPLISWNTNKNQYINEF